MDAATIAELNAGYRCPADAGPEWRKACEMGMDMSLVEENLRLSLWQRILQNDRMLEFIDLLRQGRPVTDAKVK